MTATEYKFATTLNRVRAARPSTKLWRKLLFACGKTSADGEPLSLLVVLDSNGLSGALWVLSYAMPDDRLARGFLEWLLKRASDQPGRGGRVDLNAVALTAAHEAAKRFAKGKPWGAAMDIAWDAAFISERGAQERHLRAMLGVSQ